MRIHARPAFLFTPERAVEPTVCDCLPHVSCAANSVSVHAKGAPTMRNRYAIVTAAAITIGGLIVPQALAQHDPNKGPAERAGEAIDNTGRKAGDAIDRGVQGQGTVAAPDAEGIRDVLAQVAEASVTKDGLDDLVER